MARERNDQLRRSSIHLLHRAGQSVAEIFYREMTSDLTPRQLVVLMAVARNEGASQTGIVQATGSIGRRLPTLCGGS